MRIGLSLVMLTRYPWDAQVKFVRAADRLGYATVWVSEAYGWDALTQLGSFAAVTRRIKLAAGVVNVFSRSPALIAQSAATLDRVSDGRCILGLGTSGPGLVEQWHGVPFEKPLQRLREAVEIIRLVLRRQRLEHDGQVFKLPGRIKLAVDPLRVDVPIYLATLSPRGLQMAGEVADGWLGAFFSPRHYTAVLQPDLQIGMARRPADRAPLSLCVYHPVVVSEDRAKGRDAVRAQVAFYVGAMGAVRQNFYARLFQRYGFVAETTRVQHLYVANQREEAVRAVTDEMVDAVAIVGPPEECNARLAEMASVGLDEVAIQLTVPRGEPDDVLAAMEALAPGSTRIGTGSSR